METRKEDVQAPVQPADQGVVVENGNQGGDDKDKNFSELRRQLAEKDAEIERLKGGAGDERNLAPKGDDDGKGAKKPDPMVAIFERDQREAVRLWNKQHKVTPEMWAEIKNRVQLNGDETVSEIQDKIDDAYSSLPAVQKEREDRIRNEERQKAMREFSDDDLDLGTGGSGNAGGGDGGAPRFNSKERGILKAFGVTPEEAKNIDRNAETNEWTILDPKYQDE